MYSIDQVSENGFNVFILRDYNTGCFTKIIPSCGGILHEFGIDSNGEPINVIDQYASLQEFQEQAETLGFRSCKLSPFVCRLKDASYTFGEHHYQIQNGYDQHALHGLLYKKVFTVISHHTSDEGASLRLHYQYDKEDTGFPFVYDCFVTYELMNDHRLKISTTIHNHSDGLMPVQDGWHPYFTLGGKIDDLELEFQSLHRMVFDDQLLPTGVKVKDETFGSLKKIGNIHLDNCYELDLQECQPLCVLRNVSGGIEVQLFPESSYPFLQVYTPDHRRSIAIENLSGPPNGFNLGFGYKTLQRGEEAIFSTTYKIHLLKH